MKKISKNKLAYIVVISMFLTSCGSSSDAASETNYGSDYSADYDEERGYETAEIADGREFSDSATAYKREAMFAKEGSIQNVVDEKGDDAKNFEETIVEVENLVNNYDGYFENANYTENNSKYFNTTIKVPVENFQKLYNELKNSGINVYNESSVVNETTGYYSLKSQIEVKKLAKARLETLIENSKETNTNSKDLLKLYDSYYDLVTEIETMEDTLSQIESATTYSTIYFTLNDGNRVVVLDDESFSSKIKTGFKTSVDFVENVLIALAYISVPLILVLTVAFVCYKKFSRLIKKRTKKQVEVKESEK